MTPTEDLTLVLGAGASKEVGLPIGDELKAKISSLLDIRYEHGIRRISGSHEIDAAFREKAKGDAENSINPYLHASRDICKAMPQAISIDNYLDAHSGDTRIELAGKLGIAQAILEAERGSQLSRDERSSSPDVVDFKVTQNTWFTGFFQLLTENCRVDGLEERLSRIKVVSFNYDRCLLQYLYYALQNYYRVSEHEAATLLAKFEVFHPYGKVGQLPWQRDGPTKVVPFGAKVYGTDLLELSSELRTFTEGTDPKSSRIEPLRRCIAGSKMVVFLGFAYHRLNMKLLQTDEADGASRRALGTALGISAPDCEIIKKDIKQLVGGHLQPLAVRNDLTCCALFREYWRRLSLAS